MTKLNKLCALPDTEWKLDKKIRLQETKEEVAREYSCPVSFISFRSKQKTMTMSEKQREAASERMKKS